MFAARSPGTSTPLVMLLLIVGVGVGWLVATRAVPRDTGPQREERLVNTQTVLTAVRDLARLENVSFHMERVIDLQERQTRAFGIIQANDTILLVAAGDIIAGLDLAKMQDGDVEVLPNGAVKLTLPEPEILAVTLDSKRTYVHSRRTDLLAKPGTDMEGRARGRAEEAIRSAALEAGILDRARRNAASTFSTLIRSLGFAQVDIAWRPPPVPTGSIPAPTAQ